MIVVRPVRFTDDLPAMRAFLELLGLRARIESQGGGWVDLVGDSGMLALHEAASSVTGGRPGETRLSFEVEIAETLAATLRRAGYDDASVVDEAYGRVVMVTDPLGAEIQIDERQEDLYGYHAVDAELGSEADRVGVVPVRFTDRADAYHGFLTALGGSGTPEPGGYAAYALPGEGGFVGVHRESATNPSLPTGMGASVHLTLAYDGDLASLHQRIVDSGHPVTRTEEDFGTFLELTDPDGQSVQVHAWPT